MVTCTKALEADPYRTIEPVRDEIDIAITVRGMDVEPGMAERHFGQHRREMRWAEGERHGDAQAAGQVTGGLDRLPRRVDLVAHAGRMVPKCAAGFRQGCAAGGARQKLDAEFSLKPEQPSADDRLRDAEPARSRRNASGVRDFHECLQVVDVHFGVPLLATQLGVPELYLRTNADVRVRPHLSQR